ncbi:MAG TPA: protease [Bacteroidales bacterium]|nr:protease [Bacteroidales bacterium]
MHVLFSALLIFTVSFVFAQQETKLLRFPAVHGSQVVFTYAGDLYTVARTGGVARKLTNDEGFEMFAKFSPDGKQIAFTGQYDGNTEIYVMPSEGGVPKRLTITATLNRDDISDRMGPNNIVTTWTPDGKNILYRSRKQSFNDFVGQLFKVSADGGMSEEVPLSSGGFCSFSPDGKKLAFNRVFREFRTWKYYKGGMADDVRIYDYETKKIENITNNNAQDIFPMWASDEIYFLSDRDRIMNLFCYNVKIKTTTKVTDFKEYDIKFPSLGNDAIAFENGGSIYLFDLKTKQSTKISVQIIDDFTGSRNELKDASKNINTATISPDGSRLLFGARGDIFTVPAKTGITRNLTKSSNAHERNPVWSPDGKWIAFISDMNGEFEIYIQKQDGSEKPIQLTKNADTYKYTIRWSPDSKKILWNDKMLRLQYVDIETKEVVVVDKNDVWEYNHFNWSPDSKWITFARPEENGMNRIWLYNVTSKDLFPVTDNWYESESPLFSDDGTLLFFVSARDFDPVYSSTEWNHAYTDMSRIYFVTLSKKTKSPFEPENNEVKISDQEEKKNEEKQDKGKAKNKETKEEKTDEKKINVVVDKDGIIDRIGVLPVKTSNYFFLNAIGTNLYYYERPFNGSMNIKMYNLKDKKETVLGEYIYNISADKKKMMVQKAGKYYIIDIPKDEIKVKEAVDLSGMKVWVNYKEEWKQIYNESWRQMRDFFYVSNMHGLDWKAMHKKYDALLPYVNNRNDLNYIIGELIGELNVGHAYVGGGDKISPEKISLGLLGAKVSKHASGFFKIEKIQKGQNWDNTLRSPLTEIGVSVKEGDYIIAVNGVSAKDLNDVSEAFIGMADKQTELTVNSSPSEAGAVKSIIIPVNNEANIYYYNWVQKNIEKVDKATNDQVGYIHIPNMMQEGLNEFAKYFYPQLKKKALIIDDRGNGGGNVSPMIIERLMREITRANISRNVNTVSHTPRQAMPGPKILLINQYSASDGDLFPFGFKKHQIGKVIGVRSWGGVVGIRGSLPFIDGGYLNRPEFASYSSEKSEWIIEGYGVDPDIIIDNDPAREFEGEDAQLNKAIEVILEELKNYKELPPVPPAPDKTK